MERELPNDSLGASPPSIHCSGCAWGNPRHRSAGQDVLGGVPIIDPLCRMRLGEPPTSIRWAGYAWGNPRHRSAVQDALGGTPTIDPLLRMHLGEAPHADPLCRMGVGGSVWGDVQERDGEKRPFSFTIPPQPLIIPTIKTRRRHK